jgi:hypothetical protein
MTRSWWRLRKGTVLYTRIRNMVGLLHSSHYCCPFDLELGMMSAVASLGLSLLWDTDVGLSHVDKYTYSAEEHIKVEHYGLHN